MKVKSLEVFLSFAGCCLFWKVNKGMECECWKLWEARNFVWRFDGVENLKEKSARRGREVGQKRRKISQKVSHIRPLLLISAVCARSSKILRVWLFFLLPGVLSTFQAIVIAKVIRGLISKEEPQSKNMVSNEFSASSVWCHIYVVKNHFGVFVSHHLHMSFFNMSSYIYKGARSC